MGSSSSSFGWRTAGLFLLAAGLIVAIVTGLTGVGLIRSAFEGRSVPMVDRYIAIHRSLDPDSRTLSFYVDRGLPVLYRLAGTLGAIGCLLILGSSRLRKIFTDLWNESSPPADLALFRVTVFGAMLWWLWNNPPSLYASLPSALIAAPPGLGWAGAFLPRDRIVLGVLTLAFGAACVLALIGYHTRWSAATAAALSVVVLGIPQFFGKIDHYHHFVWFSVLLAVSPSGDAWSFDAWRRRRRGWEMPTAGRAYGVPLRTAIVLIGLMYFFAGLWKYIIGGIDWGMGETMRTILHAQWMRINEVPHFRVDDLGAWTSIGGLSVMLFEVAFIALVVVRPTRLWAAAAGILFHCSILIFTGINFWTLLVCYVVFVPTAWFARQRASTREESHAGGSEDVPLRETVVVRNVLITLSILSGAFLIDSWPVAVYPTFAGIAEPRAWTLTCEAVADDGTVTQVRPWQSKALRSRYGNSRVAGFVSQIVWAQDSSQRRTKAEALIPIIAREEPAMQTAALIRVYRDLVEVDPSRWNSAPVRRELVTTWRKTDG